HTCSSGSTVTKSPILGRDNAMIESIPAGHHVLAVNYTPRTRHQPTSMRLTVRPGRGVCIHSHSRIRSGREFSAVKSYSSIKERSPAWEYRDRANAQRRGEGLFSSFSGT